MEVVSGDNWTTGAISCAKHHTSQIITSNKPKSSFFVIIIIIRQYLMILFEKSMHLSNVFALNAADEKSRVVGEETTHSTLGQRLCLHWAVLGHRILQRRRTQNVNPVMRVVCYTGTYVWSRSWCLRKEDVCLCFNGHFPGEPGLAGVYLSKGWWKWWWQLEL